LILRDVLAAGRSFKGDQPFFPAGSFWLPAASLATPSSSEQIPGTLVNFFRRRKILPNIKVEFAGLKT
jgi:hypothetical protein